MPQTSAATLRLPCTSMHRLAVGIRPRAARRESPARTARTSVACPRPCARAPAGPRARLVAGVLLERHVQLALERRAALVGHVIAVVVLAARLGEGLALSRSISATLGLEARALGLELRAQARLRLASSIIAAPRLQSYGCAGARRRAPWDSLPGLYHRAYLLSRTPLGREQLLADRREDLGAPRADLRVRRVDAELADSSSSAGTSRPSRRTVTIVDRSISSPRRARDLDPRR